jgi:Na+/phosphate symporter
LNKFLSNEKPEVLPVYARPKYLDHAFLQTLALALNSIRLEAVRFGEYLEELTKMARPAVIRGNKEDLNKIEPREKELRMLHDSITNYARRLYSMEMKSACFRCLIICSGV